MSHLVLLTTKIPGLENLPSPWEGLMVPPKAGRSLAERALALPTDRRKDVRALVSLLSEKVSAEDLARLKEAFPSLELVSNYAVGFNNIDVAAARELGIRVTNTPGVLADATANIALTLLLMTSRRILEGALEIVDTGRFGGWAPEYLLGIDLAGKTLGIVGLGTIGGLMAEKAKALGMKVVALESVRNSPAGNGSGTSGVPRVDEATFLATVDVVSFHCPLTPETRGWLSRERISKLKKGAIVINTARGEIIDESALADALEEGHLMAAGLDVFCNEPVLSETLRKAPNLVVIPHLGSATRETRAAMGQLIARSLSEVLTASPTSRLTFQVN